jgi:predicted molibdopterin-dependent oxidoreductase YjgC
VRSPLHGSKSDFDIFLHLLRALESPAPLETPEAVFEEMTRQNRNYQGIRYGEQWPKGSPFLFANGFPLRKAKLIPVNGQSSVFSGKETHPLLLIQKPSLFRSGLLSQRSENLGMIQREPLLEMNPSDAGTLGIEDAGKVLVSNPDGRSVTMKAMLTKKLAQGVVTAPYPSPLIKERGVVAVKVEKIRDL